MCLYEKEKASSTGFSLGANLTRLCRSREFPPEIPQLDCRRSCEVPGGSGAGLRGPSGAAGDTAPTTLPHSSGYPCPQPPTVFSKTQETHGTWQLWVYSRGSINAAQTPGRKEPGPPVFMLSLNDSMHGLKQDGSPPGPWCPPLSCQETHWVAALPAQGFVTLEVTS